MNSFSSSLTTARISVRTSADMACMKSCPLVSLTHLKARYLYLCCGAARGSSSSVHLSEAASMWHLSLLKDMSLCLLLLSLIMLMKYLSCMCIGIKTKQRRECGSSRCSTAGYFCPCREGREQRCACPCFPTDLKQSLRWKARVRRSSSLQGPGHSSYQMQVSFFFNILIPAIQK